MLRELTKQLPPFPETIAELGTHVLVTLERFEADMNSFDSRLREVESEQAVLKAKVALYVTVAGAIVVVAVECLRRFSFGP
jgi:hypothetical protein